MSNRLSGGIGLQAGLAIINLGRALRRGAPFIFSSTKESDMSNSFPYTDTFKRDNRFYDKLIADAAGTTYLTYVPNDREDGRHTWKAEGEAVEVAVCAYEDHYNTVESVAGETADIDTFWKRLETAAAIREGGMKMPWEQLSATA